MNVALRALDCGHRSARTGITAIITASRPEDISQWRVPRCRTNEQPLDSAPSGLERGEEVQCELDIGYRSGRSGPSAELVGKAPLEAARAWSRRIRPTAASMSTASAASSRWKSRCKVPRKDDRTASRCRAASRGGPLGGDGLAHFLPGEEAAAESEIARETAASAVLRRYAAKDAAKPASLSFGPTTRERPRPFWSRRSNACREGNPTLASRRCLRSGARCER